VNLETSFLTTERAFRAQAQWEPSLSDQLRDVPAAEDVLPKLADALMQIFI